MIKLGPWSQSWLFFRDDKSDIVHHKLSSWGFIWDLQDKGRAPRAVASLLSQYTRFPLYFSNSLICLCEWMTCPLWSKWWALLCGFVVPWNDWTSEPVKLLSYVWLFVIPWTVAYQAPLSMEFSRQDYWSGLPFPSLGDLPDPGIEPRSPTLQADALPSEPPGKPCLQ